MINQYGYFFRIFILCLLFSLISFIGVARAGLNDGLVAYYPFNGNANDESGNRNNGTVHGVTLAADRFGIQNKAYNFDGISNYIEVGDSSELRASNHTLSISLWVKSSIKDSYKNEIVLIRKGVSCYVPGWNIGTGIRQTNSNDILSLEFNSIGDSKDSWVVHSQINQDKWVHIVGVSDSNTARIYINSEKVAISKVDNSIPIDSNWPMTLGAGKQSCGDAHSFFKGIMDDIRIYSRAISESEIKQLYLEGTNSSSRAINLTISEVSPGRYRLLGTLVDANNQPACGLALASGRCVFSCGPGSLKCEGGTDSLPKGQFDLTDLPTETNGTLNMQTFVFGSMPGLQVVHSDGTDQLVGGSANSSSSRVINTNISEVSPGRYRLTGTLVDANNKPACGLALASGRCMFSCGAGSLKCEGGTANLSLGQFDLTDLPTEPDGTLNMQTFVFGSMPGLQVVKSGGGGECSYAITPKSKAFDAQGGTDIVTVSTQNNCAWTARSEADWIRITAGVSGTGPGTVNYVVSNNSGVAQRTGTLTIAGQTLTILQNAADNGGGGH